MTKIVIMLTIIVNLLQGLTISDVQYKNFKSKKEYLSTKVVEMGLPKQSIDMLLGMYLRESGLGIATIEQFDYSARKHISQVSLGDFHITFPAIVHVIKTYELKQYYHFLDASLNRVKGNKEQELAKMARYNKQFNTDIALLYFKYNYDEAVRRKMSKPVERAVSRHNGFWNNYKYVNLVKKDINNIQVALSNYKKQDNMFESRPPVKATKLVVKKLNTLELWKNI